MHEFSITEQLLHVALDAAQDAHAARITAVHVAVGSLTGVAEESMRFYFDALTPATIADGARLVFHPCPALALCADCARTFACVPPVSGVCPACGGQSIEISGGRELMVTQIEIDEAASPPPSADHAQMKVPQ